jgi:hypothetical protein
MHIAPKNIFIHSGETCRPILGDFTLGRQIGDWGCYGNILIGGTMRYAHPLCTDIAGRKSARASLRRMRFTGTCLGLPKARWS